jgi:hypothetical protein
MNYPLRPETMYMMPTHFGPMSGPRQGPNGKKFAFARDQRKSMGVSVSFLTNAEQLQPFLPPGFELCGDPVVTVFETFMKEIDWLAGRGYNVLGVTIPVAFNGKKDRAVGPFLTVIWENLTDPILTGREQLGFSKIYSELPEPVVYNGETHCTASWMGFRFLDIKLRNMKVVEPKDLSASEPRADGVLSGTLHYKYMPRTGEWGQADTEYVAFSPDSTDAPPPKELLRGDGTVEFHKARWEDLPTQYMIVNAFNELEIKEYKGATIEHHVGGGDLNKQRILK